MEKPRKPLVIFGVNAVMEKLKSAPDQVVEIIVDETERADLRAVVDEARQRGLPVRRVDAKNLNALTEGGRHQGIAAITAPYAYSSFDDLLT